MPPTIHGAPVYAGAYRGRSLTERSLLVHAIADAPITIGRLTRGPYEAFCSRAANVADDSCLWVPTSAITCPKCLAIVARVAPPVSAPCILMRESDRGARYQWRQYFVITDARVVVVEMIPALLSGWNIQRVTVQDGDAWEGLTRDQIVEWKRRADDGRTVYDAPIADASFRSVLLSRAGDTERCDACGVALIDLSRACQREHDEQQARWARTSAPTVLIEYGIPAAIRCRVY